MHMRGGSVTTQGIHEGGHSRGFLSMAAGKLIIIIIIIIIMFIYCNWVVTQWQWLFYMYTKYEIGYY